MNRFDWVGQWAAYHGPKEAISEEESGRRFTYGELNNAANALWEHLETRHNLRRGDRVAILAENHPDHFILFALAQKSGIILVPFNFRLAPPEIAFLIHDSKPALLLVEEKFRPLLAAVPDGELPPLMDFEALIALNEGHREQAPAKEALLLDEDDPLFILYTSGTTGFPKGAIYTHKMAFWNSVNTGLRLDLTSSDRTICCLPLFHTGGWNVLSVPFLHRGAYFHMTRKFEAENILTLLEKTRSTIFMGVPTILKMMAQSPQFEAVDLSSLRYFIVGGEAMPVPLILTWHEKGVPIRQGYGLTEVGPNITSLHQDDATRKIGSIGVPNFYVQTRIVGDDGRDVAPGENGELWLSGPMTT
ncbi:MAG TPA: AMP-binding protein, partial [Calditrichia bacterium]|nr:AMP-binding protein [Calditrichia bacterium]